MWCFESFRKYQTFAVGVEGLDIKVLQHGKFSI